MTSMEELMKFANTQQQAQNISNVEVATHNFADGQC